MSWSVRTGDARTCLAQLEPESVTTCITSPPYFNLRDYGVDGQIGMEATPAEYTIKLVEVFEGVKRVLREDGTLWIVIGDSYAAQGGDHSRYSEKNQRGVGAKRVHAAGGGDHGVRHAPRGMKPKDLIGVPWMLAFALRDAGWYLRQEVIWAKSVSGPVYRGGSCVPESVKDRCTRSHETIFMLSKSRQYYYDHGAIREPTVSKPQRRIKPIDGRPKFGGHNPHTEAGYRTRAELQVDGSADGLRNCRSVWHVNPKPFKGAHFAVFPPDLIGPMVLAGCPEGGTVLDPFAGSGTTGVVAVGLGRSFVGIELNPEYAEMSRERLERTERGAVTGGHTH